ncbi:hypothetical protein BH10BAC2_BH10BAC2_08990 [soil metagenome]
MKHTYVEVRNIKIAYIEKNKEAAHTIFFIHGNSVSKRSWRKQYNSTVLSQFRMIAIDLPSHGDSGTATDEVCTLPGLAGIMCEAVLQLKNDNPYILAGLSISTNIITEMLAYDVQPLGLVLSGPCIVGENYPVEKFIKPNTHVAVVFTDDPEEKDVRSYAAETSASCDEEDIHIFMEDFKAVKKPFRSLLAQSIASAIYSDEVELLKQKKIPAMVVFGKDELVVDPDYLDNAALPLWGKTIYKIEGASHLINIDQPELFNKLLKEFAEDIFR